MTDPPPRKIGSLRDRIAAFENKGPAPTPERAPPAPRPKPAGMQWKPRAASPPPPSDDSATSAAGDHPARGPGMSAADAKESIQKGGSLKERMAALQGLTAFGGGAAAPASSPPPRPSGEKPRWKPPVLHPSTEEDVASPPEAKTEDEGTAATVEEHPASPTPVKEDESRHDDAAEASAVAEQAADEPQEPDAEEEERRRRAAIAARMARLGGARIGFGPPVVGKKPEVKKHEEPKPEPAKEETIHEAKTTETEPAVSHAGGHNLPVEEAVSLNESSGESLGSKNVSTSALLSPEPSGTPSSAPHSPAMPVPAVPRRAAPPRKKNAKSPAPPTPAVEAQSVESPEAGTPQETSDDASKLLQDAVHKSKEDEVALGLHPAEIGSGDSHHLDEPVAKTDLEQSVEQTAVGGSTEGPVAIEQPIAQPAHEETPEEPEKHDFEGRVEDSPVVHDNHVSEISAIGEAREEATAGVVAQETAEPELKSEEPEAHEAEEDETARRKRIAERLRQQGGFNPFSAPPPPVRRQSTASVESSIKSPREDAAFSPQHEFEEPALRSPASPPPPPRRQSIRKSSTDSNILTSSAGLGRRTSTDSVRSPAEEHVASPIHPVSVEQKRKSTADSLPEQAGENEEEKGQDDSLAHHTIADVITEEPEDHDEYVREDEDHLSKAVKPAVYPVPERYPAEAEPQLDTTPKEEVEYEDDEPPYHFSPDVTEPVRSPPPPPKRVSLPPPPRAIPAIPQEPPTPKPAAQRAASPDVAAYTEEEDDDLHDDGARQATFVGEIETQPSIALYTAHFVDPDEQDEYVEEHRRSSISPTSRAPPPPRRQSTEIRSPTRSLPVPPPVAPLAEHEIQDHERREVHHVKSPSRSLPPPPPPPLEINAESDKEEQSDLHYAKSDDEHEPTQDVHSVGSDYEEEHQHIQAHPEQALKVVTQAHDPVRQHKPKKPSNASEREILDDSDVDPVDPEFVSPQRTSTSSNFPPIQFPQSAEVSPLAETAVHIPPVPEEPAAETQEDEEQARRRTIAERMAKLGGIRFGVPPPIGRHPPPPPRTESAEHEHEHEQENEQEKINEVTQEPTEEVNEEPEEDEAARRQRIAARLAGTGGIRFGMFPTPTATPPPPHVATPPVAQHESEEEEAPPPPPPRPTFHPPHVPPPPRHASIPPPPLPQVRAESDVESEGHSDGVRVEAEESELEEVTHDDVEEEQPPPIPSRQARRTSVPPPSMPPALPQVRPPVPIARPPPVPPPTSRPSMSAAPSHGDFVMIEESDVTDREEPPPLPPPRSVSLKKGPPARNAPPLPPPTTDLAASQQWESSLDFGGETDLSLSGQWSEDSTQYPTPPSRERLSQPPPPPPSSSATHATTLTADELTAQWGRVGVQIHEYATTLYEKSRKSLVGDRSYIGFITAVLSQVPNAAQPSPPYDTFGYLIYEQAGPAVVRHVTDIMPGDVVVLVDARLKGHKGIQMYNQHVGANEPVVAIVGDFEMKKSKVKAFQANQHVGHESVESVSYRLEDLKSGSVKIFRVLEA